MPSNIPYYDDDEDDEDLEEFDIINPDKYDDGDAAYDLYIDRTLTEQMAASEDCENI